MTHVISSSRIKVSLEEIKLIREITLQCNFVVWLGMKELYYCREEQLSWVPDGMRLIGYKSGCFTFDKDDGLRLNVQQ